MYVGTMEMAMVAATVCMEAMVVMVRCEVRFLSYLVFRIDFLQNL